MNLQKVSGKAAEAKTLERNVTIVQCVIVKQSMVTKTYALFFQCCIF